MDLVSLVEDAKGNVRQIIMELTVNKNAAVKTVEVAIFFPVIAAVYTVGKDCFVCPNVKVINGEMNARNVSFLWHFKENAYFLACDCSGFGECHQFTGNCMCRDGRVGDKCQDVCPKNKYGADCLLDCQCAEGQDCNAETGECLSCEAGTSGIVCESSCPLNKYGVDCRNDCQCKNGECNPKDGSCQCFVGFHGQLCDKREYFAFSF